MKESVDNTKLNNLMSIHPEDMSYCQREDFFRRTKAGSSNNAHGNYILC